MEKSGKSTTPTQIGSYISTFLHDFPPYSKIIGITSEPVNFGLIACYSIIYGGDFIA